MKSCGGSCSALRPGSCYELPVTSPRVQAASFTAVFASFKVFQQGIYDFAGSIGHCAVPTNYVWTSDAG